MAPNVPTLTLSSPDGAYSDALQLVPSPPLKCYRPSDLKVPSNEDFDVFDPIENGDDNFYSLKIPSPTYRIAFTPDFLISYDSDSDYSDRLSESSADVGVYTSNDLSPWSSKAEHVKSLVNRFINEEGRQHNSARLAWRTTLPATPTASGESFTTTSGLQTSSDGLETQSSSWVAYPNKPENQMVASNKIESHLRRTKSLPYLLPESSTVPQKLFSFDKVWNSSSVYQEADKEDEIKRWASAISVTH